MGGVRKVITTNIGTAYTLTLNIDMGTAEGLYIMPRTTNGGNIYTGTNLAQVYVTSSGTYTVNFTATTGTTQLLVEKAGSVEKYFYIDNVKVEQSTPTLTSYPIADVVSAQHYYPFGSTMQTWEADGKEYAFGFNGMENDNEVAGTGNSYTAEFWQYDSRLGRRFNIDPIVKEHESPYVTFANNPIWLVDPMGSDTFNFNTTNTTIYPQSGLDNQVPKPFSMTTSNVSVTSAPGNHVFFYNYISNITTNGVKTTTSSSTQFYPSDASNVDGLVSDITSTSYAFGSVPDRGLTTLAKLAPTSLLNQYAGNNNVFSAAIAKQKSLGLYEVLDKTVTIAYIVNGVMLSSGLRLKLLRSGGKVNGFSISQGTGYGAKPRFDVHPLTNPSKRTNQLNLPDWIIEKKVPIPHWHYGRGNSLRIHRPWEVPKKP